MTRVKVIAAGEPDASPIMRSYDYDDLVLLASARIVQDKIERGLKINVEEALMAYCAYVVRGARDRLPDDEIRKGASKLITTDEVMIGVPETLRLIKFEVSIGTKRRRIVLAHPIQTSSYVMSTR